MKRSCANGRAYGHGSTPRGEFLIGKQQLEQDLRDWEAAPDKDRGVALLTCMIISMARGWLI